MNMFTLGSALAGSIMATKVSGRGFTPEELADGVVDRIISISDNSHPAVQAQARAFREHIRAVLIEYGRQCVESNHTTVANAMSKCGHPELIDILEV